MKPPTKPLKTRPRQGTFKTQKAMGKNMRTTSYPSPKVLPVTALRTSGSPQKLDMHVQCRDCDHVEQKPREVTYTHDPSTWHEVVDRRGSSRSVSRTFCKQCATFIDEAPGQFHAQRRPAAARVMDATSKALDAIGAMTSKEAVTDYSPAAVEVILR